MTDIRLIEVKENILADNEKCASEVRQRLREKDIFMLNIMSSPGSGKTSLTLQTLRGLKNDLRSAVIEGDIDSILDAEKVSQEGVPVVQLRTGGACHIDAFMVNLALNEMDFDKIDFVILENVGNLVCPADFDMEAMRERVLKLNPRIKIFEESCKTGDGIQDWVKWLREEIGTVKLI